MARRFPTVHAVYHILLYPADCALHPLSGNRTPSCNTQTHTQLSVHLQSLGLIGSVSLTLTRDGNALQNSELGQMAQPSAFLTNFMNSIPDAKYRSVMRAAL